MALQLAIAAGAGGNTGYLTSYPLATTGVPNIPVDVTGAFSMMFWVSPGTIARTSGNASTATSMVGVYNGTPNESTATTTGMQMGINQGATTAGTWCCWTWGGTILVQSTAASAVANTWTHFAYTCTVSSNGVGVAGTQTHSLYINGALNNTASNALQIAGLPTMIFINGYPETAVTAGNESNPTQLDDVYLFNRLLTANEIQTIYATQGRRDGIAYGLVARYDFNERPSGTNVVSCVDFSGCGNTMTATTLGTGTAPSYIVDYADQDTRPPLG